MSIDSSETACQSQEIQPTQIPEPLNTRNSTTEPSMSRQQIRWGCRRGMLELDLMLLPFFDENFDQLSPSMREAFIALLQESDQQLQRWFLGSELPDDPKMQDLTLVIRHYGKIQTIS